MITKLQAIRALVGDINFGVTSEGEILWHEEPSKKPTEKEIEAKLKELKEEYNNKQYQRDRAKEYDTIPEQLDQIYHNFDEWKTKIKSVKDKFPKPS